MCDNILPTGVAPCVCRWSQVMINHAFTMALTQERICGHERLNLALMNPDANLFIDASWCPDCKESVPTRDIVITIPDLPKRTPGWGTIGKDL